MGWMSRKSHLGMRDNIIAVQIDWSETKDVPSVDFVEDTNDPKSFKRAPIDTSNDDLPLIDASIVIAAGKAGLLWIVIDDIVYDCTDFVEEHPGGSRVLESFRSGNCSWQFWRFHGEKDLEEFGRPLRVGRTTGIENKFKEPPRFFGLRKLWGDD
ncbi:Cytochrome b5 heme-binding domain-containing protein [Fusarium falciforme]|uniref:Cytochrome b5 heme-binding domain-containing protein n=1 Tax=Fusarium falciforme TaxID=195108 RepID=UPI0022FFDB96|nr:Cytochrome b5 heme-binding domain-containing protein [Fusarium falciforme]WAO95226.1 Cytochrome b5 heme-binding domain-containing protein [Fusarium falciforme]